MTLFRRNDLSGTASLAVTMAAGQSEPRRIQIAREIWKLPVDQVRSIGMGGQSPATLERRRAGCVLL